MFRTKIVFASQKIILVSIYNYILYYNESFLIIHVIFDLLTVKEKSLPPLKSKFHHSTV